MTRFFVWIAFIFVGCAVYGATCDIRFYMDESGKCAPCKNSAYYCPGDDKMYECPSVDGRVDSDAIARENYNSTVTTVTQYDGGTAGNADISSCIASLWLSNVRGNMIIRYSYSRSSDKYDVFHDMYWTKVSSGYYVHDLYECWGLAMFTASSPCVAGGYCPGMTITACPTGTRPESMGLYVCPDNTYSDAGASGCKACPAGTGNRGDAVSAHAGVSSCKQLCTAGATKLHAGGYEFNLWANGKCTSPAINIGLAGGTCCVNLESGLSDGAVNVQYGGNTYHTTN